MCEQAKLVVRDRHRDWVCPSCSKLLAKVYDDRVVVQSGNLIATFPIDQDVTLTCPRCFTRSSARMAVAA